MAVPEGLKPHLVRTAKILTGCLATYFMLFMVNQALPWVAPPTLLSRPNAIGMPPGLMIPDDQLGYAFPAHWHGQFLGLPEQQVSIDTNGHGWRDDEFLPPGEGAPRVLVLGDSITMGVGVEARARYSERLQAMFPGSQFDNCAASGYELNQLLTLAGRMLPETKPDMVLYGICLNDIRVAPIERIRYVDEQALRIRIRAAFELRHIGRMWGNLMRIRRESQLSRTGARPAEARVMKRWQDPAQRAAYADRLGQLQQLCDAAGARLVAVIFPYTFQFDTAPDDPIHAPQRYLHEMLEARQIPYLDLFEPLQAATTHVFLPGDNCHPNATGNGVVADSIAAWLRGLGLVGGGG